MFQDLKPYPEYVATESPWLRQVPTQWSMPRMKSVVNEISDKGYPDEPLLAATQSRGVIRKDEYGSRTVEATKSLETLKRVLIDDFVISLRSFQGGIERAYSQGIISPAYTILRAKHDASHDYLTLLFKSRPFVDALRLAVTGIREGQNIEYPRLARDPIPVPPVEEQRAIVSYLAHAHQRINKAIATKRRLVALLQEQTRVLGRDVMAGRLESDGTDLDSDSPRVPWLGPTSKDWPTVPLKRVARLRAGAGFPVARQGIGGMEIPFFRVSDMALPENGVWLTQCDSTISREEAAELGAVIFPRDTIVFPKVGGALLTNKRRLLDRPSCLDNNLMGAVFTGLETEFAFELMRLIDLGDFVKPGPVPAIGQGDVGAIRLPLPVAEVQAALVERLHNELASVLAATDVALHEISLLEEFRARLTADVVTGQVDVRSVAATLPPIDLADVFAVSAGAVGADDDETADEVSMEDE